MVKNGLFRRWIGVTLLVLCEAACAGRGHDRTTIPVDPLEHATSRCEAGQGWACTRVGYENDMAGEYAQAARFYRRGCELGSTWGCDELGGLYDSGGGAPLSRLSAIALYARACEGGFAVGCYHSGRAMMEVDPEAAMRDLERACASHVAQACGLWARTLIAADPDGDVASLVDQVHASCRDGDSSSCEWLANELGATESSEALLDSLEARAIRACSAGSAGRCVGFLGSSYDEFRASRGDRRVGSARELALDAPHLAVNYLFMCVATEWAEWDYDADGNYAHTCDTLPLEIIRAADVGSVPSSVAGLRGTLEKICDDGGSSKVCALAGALGVRGIHGPAGGGVALARLGAGCTNWAGGCAPLAVAFDEGVGTTQNAGLATMLWARACGADVEGACERGAELADSSRVSDAVRREYHALRCTSSDEISDCSRGCELGDRASCLTLGHRHYDYGTDVPVATLRIAHREFVAECERGGWSSSMSCSYAANALLAPDSPLHDEDAAFELLEDVCDPEGAAFPIVACEAYAREELRARRDDATRRRMLEVTGPVCSRFDVCDVFEDLAPTMCASNPVSACSVYAARHVRDDHRASAIAVARTLCDVGDEDGCTVYLSAFDEGDLPDANEQAAYIRIAWEYVEEYEDCGTARTLSEVYRSMPARQRPADRVEELGEILEEYCGY